MGWFGLGGGSYMHATVHVFYSSSLSRTHFVDRAFCPSALTASHISRNLRFHCFSRSSFRRQSLSIFLILLRSPLLCRFVRSVFAASSLEREGPLRIFPKIFTRTRQPLPCGRTVPILRTFRLARTFFAMAWEVQFFSPLTLERNACTDGWH